MMKRKLLLVIAGIAFFMFQVSAQTLQPGFEAREYLNLLAITFGKYDSMAKKNGVSAQYKWAYRSQVTGLDNRWFLWLSNDNKQGVISIRGTVGTMASWLANVYSVMQPATGSIQLNDSITFHYQLAENPNAAVHTGWLISLGYLANDIERKIKEQYDKGIKDFLIVGHSQGGGIAYLLRSYLYYRTKEGALPADITYKTYCSAAPKPGNLYYAYDYDFINRNGWAFNIVNAADWVPETPISIQQLRDLNQLNPFTDIKNSLRKQKYIIRLYAGLVYNRLDRATRKAAYKYQKYVGKKVNRQVEKKLTQLQELNYVYTMNYMRAGTPIVLMPDTAYYQKFLNSPNKGAGIFNHHTYEAYELLTRQGYSNPKQ